MSTLRKCFWIDLIVRGVGEVTCKGYAVDDVFADTGTLCDGLLVGLVGNEGYLLDHASIAASFFLYGLVFVEAVLTQDRSFYDRLRDRSTINAIDRCDLKRHMSAIAGSCTFRRCCCGTADFL